MSYEKGGRASKFGNKYEELFVIYELLNVVLEANISVVYEPLGPEEEGVDLIVTTNDDRTLFQCKGRNSHKNFWECNDLKKRRIFEKWQKHLVRDDEVNVGLVSPLSCTTLEDIIKRSLNTPSYESFFQYQIHSANADTQKFYLELIKSLGIESNTGKVLPFLNRIKLEQISESNIERSIDLIIRLKFENDLKQVKNALYSFIKNEDIYGKEIDIYVLNRYFSENDIRYIELSNCVQNIESINRINTNFSQCYTAINNSIIERDETKTVVNNIINGNNVVIHGAAGYGKSGVLQHTIIKLNEMSIPYLSINLADTALDSSFEIFYNELGLKKSPAICLDVIKKNGPVVLIFDQLDSIKWINSKSTTCINNLKRIFDDVKGLNKNRKSDCKISIVVSCRTYDLENDRLLKNIFDDTWKRILVGKMNYENISRYIDRSICKEFVETLRIPNNLFIYLNIKDKVNIVNGTSIKLIEEWIDQICRESKLKNCNIRNEIYIIVNKMNALQVLSLNNDNLGIDDKILEYLISENLIVRINNKISFTHQTTYDYLISKKMFDDYLSTEKIVSIIPLKKYQTPIERYKLQMFMDRLLDFDENKFIEFAEKFLVSKNVRMYYKYLISEILCSILEPSDIILEYVSNNYTNSVIYNACIKNKVFSRKIRSTFMKTTRLSQFDKEFIIKGIRFLKGNVEDYDVKDILSFDDPELNKELFNSLDYRFYNDSEKVFDFRYNYMLNNNSIDSLYISDLNKAFEMNDIYTTRLIELLFIKNKKHLSFFTEEKLTLRKISNPKQVFDILFKLIPLSNLPYDEWTGTYHSHNIQRLIVNIVKVCNSSLVETDFSDYFQLYDSKISSNSYVINELFLDFLSKNKNANNATQIINYVSKNIEFTLEHASGKSKVYYLSLILGNNLNDSNKTASEQVLDAIYYYNPKNIISYYKTHKEHRQFFCWGKLQHDILNALDEQLLNKKCIELKKVLNRRMPKGNFYNDYQSSFGSVVSPLYNKKISENSWIKLINNGDKISTKDKSLNMTEEGYYIESNVDSFSSDFVSVVKQNPIFYIDYFSKCKRDIHEKFINAFFYGISECSCYEGIDKNKIQNIIMYYMNDNESERVKNYLSFLSKNISYIDEEIINCLFEKVIKTAKEHGNLKYEMYKLNSTYGELSLLVSSYLWESKKMNFIIENIIEYYYNNEDFNIRFCSLEMLTPVLNINKDYSVKKILSLLKEPKMFNYYNINKLILHIYQGNQRYIHKCIYKTCKKYHENDEAIKMALYSATEIYIHTGSLKNIVFDRQIKKKNSRFIVEMLEAYENHYDSYRRIKKLLSFYSEESQHLICNLIKANKLSFSNDEKIIKYALFKYKNRGLKLFDYIEDLECDFHKNFASYIIRHSQKMLKEDYFSKEEYSKIIMQLYGKYQNDEKLCNKLLDVIDLLYCDGCAIQIIREYVRR